MRYTMKTTCCTAWTIVLALGCALAPSRATEPAPSESPFNGKDLTGWKTRADPAFPGSHWVVGAATVDRKAHQLIARGEGHDLVNTDRGADLYTEAEYGDCVLTLDVMVNPGYPANSGIKLQGVYEIQIQDSYDKQKKGQPITKHDMGGIYTTAAPTDPVYKPAGEWQSFEIHFQAPRFDAKGKKTAHARFLKVVLNGKTIHDNVELTRPSGGEHAKSPLVLQGTHGRVAYRNIRVSPPVFPHVTGLPVFKQRGVVLDCKDQQCRGAIDQ